MHQHVAGVNTSERGTPPAEFILQGQQEYGIGLTDPAGEQIHADAYANNHQSGCRSTQVHQWKLPIP